MLRCGLGIGASGKAELQREVADAEMQQAAPCPMHQRSEADDEKDDQHKPKKKHHYAGDGIAAYLRHGYLPKIDTGTKPHRFPLIRSANVEGTA